MRKVINMVLCLFLTLSLLNFSVSAAQEEGKKPDDINGLKMWFDASEFNLENEVKVSNWPNKAGDNNFDAKQSTASDQPTFIKEGKVNGKPAVRFTSESMLEIATKFYMNEMTIFAVVYIDTINDYSDANQIFSKLIGESDGFRHNWWLNIDEGCFNFGFHNGSAWVKAGLQDQLIVDNGKSYIFAGMKDDDGGTLFINGIEEAFFSSSGEPNDCDSSAFIGRSAEIEPSESLNGDFCEIIVFDRALSGAEIKEVHDYLNLKYFDGNNTVPTAAPTSQPPTATYAPQTTAAANTNNATTATATTITATSTQSTSGDPDNGSILPLILIISAVAIGIGASAFMVMKKKK